MDKEIAIFVDEEAQCLRSIQRALRPLHKEWEFRFETSVSSALKLLSTEDVAAVITEKKMVEMDGDVFLAQVKQLHPRTVRVLLTGDVSKETVVASAKSAHLLLAKPFETEELQDILDRAGSLSKLSLTEAQRNQLGKIDNLPVLPKAFHELTQYLKNNSEPEVEQVAEYIRQDIGITTKLLQLANSSFFGYQSHTVSIEQMVLRLGFELIRQVTALMALSLNEECSQLIQESESVALDMQRQAEDLGMKKIAIQECMLLGFIHKLGKMVSSSDSNLAGAYLLNLWGFRKELIEAVMFQTNPEQQEPLSPLTCMLYIAKWQAQNKAITDIPNAIIDCANSIEKEMAK